MAEYIKFRLTAAKAAVTMAFLALVGSAAGTAEAVQQGPSAHPASFSWGAHYLKLDGLGAATRGVFLKLELKLHETFGNIDQTLSRSFYSKHKADLTFLKIDKANQEFLKLDDANANFLKIGEANAEFLKIGATAANSNELGGMTPDSFVQGHANIVSGQASITDGTSQPLLQSPDGMIRVSVSVDANGNQSLVIHNGSATDLTAVFDPTAVERTLPAGQDFTFPLGNVTPSTVPVFNPTMTHVQIFPGGSLSEVLTLIVSTETPVKSVNQAVGQMLIGLL